MKIKPTEAKIFLSNKILFDIKIVNEHFDFNEKINEIINRHLPTEEDEYKELFTMGQLLYKEVKKFMIDTGLIEETNDDKYMLTPYAAAKKKEGGIVSDDLIIPKTYRQRKFRKSLIKLLKKENRHQTNVSKLLNDYIGRSMEIKNEVHKDLVYLIKIKKIEIKDNPGQGVEYWWGNFIGCRCDLGIKIKDVYASLTTEYINKHIEIAWQKKYWLPIAIFAYLLGFVSDIGKEALRQKIWPTSIQSSKKTQLRSSLDSLHEILIAKYQNHK